MIDEQNSKQETLDNEYEIDINFTKFLMSKKWIPANSNQRTAIPVLQISHMETYSCSIWHSTVHSETM